MSISLVNDGRTARRVAENIMTENACRSIGSITGLVLGLTLMFALGLTGMVAGALFGAGGAVAGGISGEKFYAWQRRG